MILSIGIPIVSAAGSGNGWPLPGPWLLEPEFVIADEPHVHAGCFHFSPDIQYPTEDAKRTECHAAFHYPQSCRGPAIFATESPSCTGGRLMEVGRSEQVIQNPRHPYTKALIDALPKFGHSGKPKAVWHPSYTQTRCCCGRVGMQFLFKMRLGFGKQV